MRRHELAARLLHEGVEWIAMNDEPDDLDPESIAGYISTLLLSDLLGVDPTSIAKLVIAFRSMEARGSQPHQQDRTRATEPRRQIEGRRPR